MSIATSREEWLSAALTRITRGWPTAAELPENTRVSVGFPVKTRGRGAGRVTEHYAARESAGGFVEIFVSPTLGTAESAARALAFEAAAVALNRSPDASERDALTRRADAVIRTLPPYPHDALNAGTARSGSAGTTAADVGAADASGTPARGPGSRLLKVSCTECGYTMRITRVWILRAVPRCPLDDGHGLMLVHAPVTNPAEV